MAISIGASLLMMVGVLLLFRGLTAPPKDDNVQTRLTAYGVRPPTLEELELRKPMSERVFKPIIAQLSRMISQRTPQKTLDDIRRNLELAGNPNNLSVADFLGLRGFAALAVGGIALLLLSRADVSFIAKILGPIGGAFIGNNMPGFWLGGKVGARQKEILKALPDALDLLTISVEAGLGFEQAMQKVAEKWENALTVELRRVLREQRMGMSRRDSLRAMATRSNVEDLSAFASAIIQADQLGVPIARILNIQSEQMRVKRRQRAEKLAHEAPLKMTFPMVLFMMPSLWVIILGPMIPNMMIMMGGG